jgi:hypothetical protein
MIQVIWPLTRFFCRGLTRPAAPGRLGYGRDVNSRTVTDSIESRTDPAILVALLADPRRSPEWAPGFADAVTEDDLSGWRATKDGNDFTFRVVARPDAGTVDYLREIAPGAEAGAYIRVIPRPGGGSVVVMTLPVAPGVERAATAATVRDELAALVSVGESR